MHKWSSNELHIIKKRIKYKMIINYMLRRKEESLTIQKL